MPEAMTMTMMMITVPRDDVFNECDRLTSGVLSLQTYPKVEVVKAWETISKNCAI